MPSLVGRAHGNDRAEYTMNTIGIGSLAALAQACARTSLLVHSLASRPLHAFNTYG